MYTDDLKKILDEKKARNPYYSIRALARDLDMDAAYLIHILSGKKKVSPKIAFKIAKFKKLEGQNLLEFILPSLDEEK